MAVAALAVATAPVARAQNPPKNFVMHEAPKPMAAVAFEDGQGRAGTLADFKGRVVLVNLWATWCVPCRKEMPALDRLQAALDGPDFQIVPISLDRGGVETVHKFYTETGLQHLGMYLDVSGQSLRALGAIGLPTTLLLARDGSEIGRIVGPAVGTSLRAWNSSGTLSRNKTNLRVRLLKARTVRARRQSPVDSAAYYCRGCNG
jgi:thiol-disulfide isomerase/thioredoxin